MTQSGGAPVPLSPRQGPSRSGAKRRHNAYVGLSLMLLIFASYLLFYSGIFHSSDARFILAATESMVKRAEFTAAPLWWHKDAIETVAPDGEPYSKYGISASLMAAPMYILALNWPRLGMVQAVMMTNLLLTAANAFLVFKIVSSLGYKTVIALSTSFLFALCTSAMVYAHYYFTEPLSALALTGSMLGLYLYRVRRQKRYAWLTGVAMSLAVATKLINALFLVPLLVYAFYSIRTQADESGSTSQMGFQYRGRKVISAVVPIGLPLVITLVILGIYNALRFGSPFISGYPPWELFDNPLLAGLWGLLFGSETGLFVYNPILLVSLIAFPLFWRRHRPEALAILAIAALHLVTYARWHAWQGGVAWGPRFLVPLLPLLILPLAPLLEELWPANRGVQGDLVAQPVKGVRSYAALGRFWNWGFRAGLLAVGAVSLGVQVVGSGVSFLRYGDRYGQWAAQSSSVLYRLGQRWPVLGHALLFQPANWDAAWVQGSRNQVAIDWIALVMLVSLVLLTSVGLVVSYQRRHYRPRRWLGLFQLLMVVLAVCVSLTLLVRSRNDNRFGGGDDYHTLLQTLADVSLPGDLILLNNHIYTDFFFNHNRSLPRWYALDRQADMAGRTERLLTRNAQRYRRIWLVTDLSPDSNAGRPVEAWLTQRVFKVNEVVFSPYARLLLYDTTASPQSARQSLNVQVGESIELTAYDLAFSTRSEPVRLTLYWQALRTLPQDLTVFLQLLDDSGQLVWQADRYPVDGFRPTSSWGEDEIIVDRYGWQLPSELPPGNYRLIVGLYDWQTGQRLPVSDSQGAPLGDYVVLDVLSIPPAVGE